MLKKLRVIVAAVCALCGADSALATVAFGPRGAGLMGGPDPSPVVACFPREVLPSTDTVQSWTKTGALINDSANASDFALVSVSNGANGGNITLGDFSFAGAHGGDGGHSLYAVSITFEYVAAGPYQIGITGIEIVAHNEQGALRSLPCFDNLYFNGGNGVQTATGFFVGALTLDELNDALTLTMHPFAQSDGSYTASIRNVRLHLVGVD